MIFIALQEFSGHLGSVVDILHCIFGKFLVIVSLDTCSPVLQRPNSVCVGSFDGVL